MKHSRKSMSLLWNFISNRLGDTERFECVARLVVSYLESCDFEDDFHIFVDMLTLMLFTDNIKDWKNFYQSTTVMPYQVSSKVNAMIGMKINSVIDGRWKDLAANMMIAYNDPNEWHKMSTRYNCSSDKNDITVNNINNSNINKKVKLGQFYDCTKRHAMVPFVLKESGKDELSKHHKQDTQQIPNYTNTTPNRCVKTAHCYSGIPGQGKLN